MEKIYNHLSVIADEPETKASVDVKPENKNSLSNVLKKLLTKDKDQCDIHDLSQFAWP